MEHANDATIGQAWGETTCTYSVTVATPSSIAAGQLVSLARRLRDIDETSYILDIGTGTGALALDVAEGYPMAKILATDISTGMIEHVAEYATRLGIPNIKTQVLDAQQTYTLGQNIFSHVFSTFVLQFVLEPDVVLSQTYDALKPGGVVGFGIWYQTIHPFEIWQKACRTIDPDFQIETEFPDPNAWLTPDQAKQHLESAGFVDVQVTDIWMPFKFADFEAYMKFWDSGKNPSAWHVIRQWKRDRQQAMDAVRQVVFEQYGNGQDIRLHAILAVGKKA